jgi:hypothetical protein
MRRDEDAKDGNVDARHDGGSSPFDLGDCASVFGDDGDSVDDDLHQELDFKDPEEKNEEEDRNTTSTDG